MKKIFAVLVLSTFCALGVAKTHATGGKTVRIHCSQGQTSSAGGTYGGVSFSVGCHNGNDGVQTIMPTGTVWNSRTGVEDHHNAYDCADSGDSETVNTSCVGTVLTIQ